MSTRISSISLLAAALLAMPASAQLLGGVGQTVGSTVGSVTGGPLGGVLSPLGQGRMEKSVNSATQAAVSRLDSLGEFAGDIGAHSLDALRRERLSALISGNRATLDQDERGQPVRRGALIAVDPSAADLAAAARIGFTVSADRAEPNLGLRMVILAIPGKMNIRKALSVLRGAAPAINADYDHIFEPAGGPLAPAIAAGLAGAVVAGAPGRRIAMIDGGAANHPSLSRASIEQKGFSGPAAATGHGTAVASLLVGDQGPFHGAARGASLFVADIYGGNPAAGSASAIVAALGWAASKRPSAITMSLVGPDNRALAAAVNALRRRGITIVAAVGNDGPAAPPSYPASYPGVVAVTGVDGKGRALLEAGRSSHIDFAAPGADIAAATPGRGYARVRGTSFAAPLATARFVALGSVERLAAEAVPGKGRVGRGIVCATCGTAPQAVGAK